MGCVQWRAQGLLGSVRASPTRFSSPRASFYSFAPAGMSCQTAAMDNATEVPGLTQGRCLDNSQPFSSNVRGAAWALEFTIKTIGKLGEKKEFKTRTARKIIQRIPDLLIEELGIELEEVYLSMLLDCSLGIDPSQATRLYNERIPRVLSRFRSLDARCSLVNRYRTACKLEGWSVCENPRCARVFELSGTSDGLCSQKCRKSMRNRRAWFRRKSA